MKTKNCKSAVLGALLSSALAADALEYKIVNDHENLLYRCEEKAVFTVTVTERGSAPASGVVKATLDNTGKTIFAEESWDLSKTNVFSMTGSLDEPGFLRLRLSSKGVEDRIWSVGFDPECIHKGSPSPCDFDSFWRKARARLAAEVPLDPQMEEVPARSTDTYTFYDMSFATFGRRVYGSMTVPKSGAPTRRLPVCFSVNAAGFGDWTNDFDKRDDTICVQFSVYPFPMDNRWRELGLKEKLYDALNAETKRSFGTEYQCSGITLSREDYFYYPVILGIDRAVDWLAARPDVDRSRFCYQGTSQGGGIGMALCALNHTFTKAAFYVPAITDTMGYVKGRQSGWPYIVESNSSTAEARRAAALNAPYFDAANFASRIKCPVRVAVGFSDPTCPPCAVYAAYNEIDVKDKEIVHGIGMTHSCYGWIYGRFGDWTREPPAKAGAVWKDELPRPIFDEHPELCDLYMKAWEIAHDHIHELQGLPSPRHMDEGLWDDRVWIWDTCFMAQYCKYAPREFPGVESLENFYSVMLADGETPLPRVRCEHNSTGVRGGIHDFLIHHPDNPPLFAWTEYKYALQTGDRARLEKIYSENGWLQKWYDMFESFDPEAPKPHGAACGVALRRVEHGYLWQGCPNGMDNSPRGRPREAKGCHPWDCPNNPDLLWIDAFAQQALSALCISRIAGLLGRDAEAKAWMERYEGAKREVNALYWDEADGMYYDLLRGDLSKLKVLTPASFWPALAEMPTKQMMDAMCRALSDSSTLGGDVPTPSVARNDRDFDPQGGYWRGGIWLPTSYMTVKALDAYGDYARARDVSRRIVERMYRTYVGFEPHTIWECYSPTEDKPSTDKDGHWSRADFCGWSALGPISLFIEDIIGVKEADAFSNTLVCDFEKEPKGRVGVENYRFGNVLCSIIADRESVRVSSSLPFRIFFDGECHDVRRGENNFRRR